VRYDGALRWGALKENTLSDAQQRTPKPVAVRPDLRGASLSPTDGFVLSRVDGKIGERDLAASAGLPDDQVRASLAKLEGLGLITFDGGKEPPSPNASGTVNTTVRASSVSLRAASPSPQAAVSASAIPLTADEEAALAEDVDLDPELRLRVLRLHRQLQQLDHYALFEVARTADKKAIKRAYFDYAAKFHPDRYFRKRLGSFKLRMEAIFSRVTISHDALVDPEKRQEYDAYLAAQRESRGMEALMEDALAEVRRAQENVERQVQAQAAVSSLAPPGAPSFTPPRVSALPPSVEVDLAARRDALARRLLGGRPLSSTSPPAGTPPATPQTATTPAAAVDALRRRYEDRMGRAKEIEARKYAEQAAAALASGDLIAATNAYRVACNLAPGDTELSRKAGEAQAKADVLLAQTYTQQAQYEEKNAQWAEAARSWGRVCKARPNDSKAHERAANAIVHAGGDLHEGARLAKQACELDPKSAPFRVTLANVYLAAGLSQNARRELDTAAQLSPHDDTIRAMLKRLGKQA
jgi:curved DNA-binding protein CbpA